jgi:hypothetical protein
MHYECKYFDIYELAAPKIIADIGEVNAWRRLKRGALMDLDTIREHFGSEIYINGNYWGKIFNSSGWRHPDDPDGAKWSVHKLADAYDLKAKNGEHQKLWDTVYYLILTGKLEHFNTMEDRAYTKSWTHVANMNTDLRPLIIKP